MQNREVKLVRPPVPVRPRPVRRGRPGPGMPGSRFRWRHVGLSPVSLLPRGGEAPRTAQSRPRARESDRGGTPRSLARCLESIKSVQGSGRTGYEDPEGRPAPSDLFAAPALASTSPSSFASSAPMASTSAGRTSSSSSSRCSQTSCASFVTSVVERGFRARQARELLVRPFDLGQPEEREVDQGIAIGDITTDPRVEHVLPGCDVGGQPLQELVDETAALVRPGRLGLDTAEHRLELAALGGDHLLQPVPVTFARRGHRSAPFVQLVPPLPGCSQHILLWAVTARP